MDYSSWTRTQLIDQCRIDGFRGYSSKNKSQLIQLLQGNIKKNTGQYYTTNCDLILSGFPRPPDGVRCVIEPFAGQGHLVDWIKTQNWNLPIEAYDLHPGRDDIIQQNTLQHPPNYTDAWIITNPPYLARNKSMDKDIFNQFQTNDLYKCFLTTILSSCRGGIIIIPAGFLFSPRDIDVRCRHRLFGQYMISKIKYFEQPVFADTTTAVVAIAFVRPGLQADTKLKTQSVEWERYPSGARAVFSMDESSRWIVGGQIYQLPISSKISIRRAVDGTQLNSNEYPTFLLLNALDSAEPISLTYKSGFIYPGKESSRTYATLQITGRQLTELEQIQLSERFNQFIKLRREETWSLFLPQYREFSRRRIPFELAYRIIVHLIEQMFC